MRQWIVMFKRKVCSWLIVLSTALVTNLSYSQEMTPELFFAKKKLQKAAIAYTAAMETCFEHTPRVRPSELETDKLEIELVVEAVNYLHYVVLNDCMQDHDVNFLKAVDLDACLKPLEKRGITTIDEVLLLKDGTIESLDISVGYKVRLKNVRDQILPLVTSFLD